MKISNNQITKNYTDLQLHTKENPPAHRHQEFVHSFDEIMIQSDGRQIEERTFQEAVVKRVREEVAQISSEEKVQALQQQVAAGTYKIDPYAIASRMLLL